MAHREERPATASAAASIRTGGARRADLLDGFDAWWSAYPRRVGKKRAREVRKRLEKKGELPKSEVLIPAGRAQTSAKGWREELRFCPHPTTWLNEGPWEDEVPEPDWTPRGMRLDGRLGIRPGTICSAYFGKDVPEAEWKPFKELEDELGPCPGKVFYG